MTILRIPIGFVGLGTFQQSLKVKDVDADERHMGIRVSTLRRVLFAIGVTALAQVSLSNFAVVHAREETARSGIESLLSIDEFSSLAGELAQKVNLFSEVWRNDPKAEFFGGTTRDYLYWIKGQFRGLKTREQALAKVAELKAFDVIDVRDFVVGDSDVDIVNKTPVKVFASTYGVRKIDQIDDARFDPETEMGQTEAQQGYIPVEKIRLGRDGLVPWKGFEGGAKEIYTGRLTVHFATDEGFAKTFYAKSHLNHPVLLAIRYIRNLAINYYQDHGGGYPELTTLLDIDPSSRAAANKVISRTLETTELYAYLLKPRFLGWLNQTLRKTFRSYTNPTAAMELCKAFQLDRLVARYAGKIEPINQYLFAKHRDDTVIRSNLKKYAVSPETFYADPEQEFKDLELYHGTRTENAFRAILLQGVLPSQDGSADGGLYGVGATDIDFAIGWGKSIDRVVRFKISRSAKVVDITQGEGLRVFLAFDRSTDEFAEAFGVDILRYPYSRRAYVVKNSAILEHPSGYTRQVMTFSRFKALAEAARTEADVENLVSQLMINNFSKTETLLTLKSIPASALDPLVSRILELFRDTIPFSDPQPVEEVPLAARAASAFTLLRLHTYKNAVAAGTVSDAHIRELETAILGDLDRFVRALNSEVKAKAVRNIYIQRFANLLVDTAEANELTWEILEKRLKAYPVLREKLLYPYKGLKFTLGVNTTIAAGLVAFCNYASQNTFNSIILGFMVPIIFGNMFSLIADEPIRHFKQAFRVIPGYANSVRLLAEEFSRGCGNLLKKKGKP